MKRLAAISWLVLTCSLPSAFAAQSESFAIGPLIAQDALSNDEAGMSIALDSGTLITGVPRRGDLGASAGAAYVWRLTGTTWSQEAKLLAGDGTFGDLFGRGIHFGRFIRSARVFSI